jgi:uncharacterized protein YciI
VGVTVADHGPEGHRTFYVAFTPTRADWPEAMTADEKRALSEHADGLSRLADEGTCVIAGPTLDAQIGIAVYDGKTVDETLALVEKDPMVVAGYFDATMRAMRLSFEREKPSG